MINNEKEFNVTYLDTKGFGDSLKFYDKYSAAKTKATELEKQINDLEAELIDETGDWDIKNNIEKQI